MPPIKSDWSIRKAVLSDSVALSECMISAYTVYQDRMSGNRLPPMDVDYLIEIRDYPCWIVEHDGVIAGGLIMVIEKEYASIANIALHPDFQGQGIGGLLMKYAENVAKEHGLFIMHLATHILLSENISLYTHLGWLEYKRDNFRVYMKKEIK